MSKYKGISKKTIKLILKLKKMKKDKKKAKRRIKRTLKQTPETFFGKNRVGGGGGGGFGQSHTNTIVLPNNDKQNQQKQHNDKEDELIKKENELIKKENEFIKKEGDRRFLENETKIKLLENNASDFLNFKNSLTIYEPPPKAKAKGPITRRKATLIDETIHRPIIIKKPITFVNPVEQQQREQNNTLGLNIKTEHIVEPEIIPMVDTNDNVGGATINNSSDLFVEEAPEIFGLPEEPPPPIPADEPAEEIPAEEIPAEEIPAEEIPIDEPIDAPPPLEEIPEEIPEDDRKDPNPHTIAELINLMPNKQKSSYRKFATKNGMDLEEYLLNMAQTKGYGDGVEGVSAFIEKRKPKK